ncbi:MAG: hypothetical protein GC204_03100 [Chloroflexi bacterium]|nr:hypothetical protein [Chloroflexota bacterium]
MTDVFTRLKDTPETKTLHFQHILPLLIIAVCATPIWIYSFQDLRWSPDIVPVLQLGREWLNGGLFPLHGTVSSFGTLNPPGLVWLYIPAQIVTGDIPTIIISTSLIWALFGVFLFYGLCHEFFGNRLASIATALYVFNPLVIEGSYTAWAQYVIIPIYVAFVYALLRWHRTRQVMYGGVALVLVIVAFSIHFSAIVLVGVFVLITAIEYKTLRLKPILACVVISFLWLAPYLYFEAGRSWADLQALFLNRPVLISNTPEVISSAPEVVDLPSQRRDFFDN